MEIGYPQATVGCGFLKKEKLKNNMPRGKPKPRQGKELLAWRSRQKPGAIMKPETFKKIEEEATKRYGSRERGKAAAGAAYWTAAEAKFRKRKKGWRMSDTGVMKA
uniref:Uncharacterized protein n=1 Tax=candidate division CPR3 bacterium TaxID=2268181 RepID=A0A7V3JAQ3_UNCC3